ncbi:MAG: excinuclease ABC subunit A [Maribacter sp.]|jgi:excinuclease ABC subunit A
MSKKVQANTVAIIDEDNIPENSIYIKGAKGNNLKNVSIVIPKDKLIVVTGVSGSGKSSITMDTLYAEGQRRYVESLSSYARQFLMRMKKPEVDYIKGICPAIAIEQKVTTKNSRSTVGSLTEIYDYLRILFARAGKTYSPVSGKLVKKHEVTDAVNYIQALDEGTKVQLFIPIQKKYDRTLEQELNLLLQKGYTRIHDGKTLNRIEDILENTKLKLNKSTLKSKWQILIDRIIVKNDDEENRKRIADSIQTAFLESEGDCIVNAEGKKDIAFNNRFEIDGIIFNEPSIHFFNYNNPYGACKTCEGYGKVIGISEDKVIPQKSLSVLDNCIACWRGEKGQQWKELIVKNAHKFDFPVHIPYKDLSDDQKDLLWDGNAYFDGINTYFKELESQTYKIQNRVILARYRGKTPCNSCKGGRLRIEATYVKIDKKDITELVNLPIDELLPYFDKIKLNENDTQIAKRLILEITNRLQFMEEVGLGYLTLNRISSTLSGGETQRINLTRTLGSNLTSSLYILDEPSIGLHPRDTSRLVKVLKDLRDLGNTVVVVEHEEDIIKNADYLIDMGPHAGIHGGEVVFAGDYEKIHDEASDSLTAKYMSGRMQIPVPEIRRKYTQFIEIKEAAQHNLKDVTAKIPLSTLTVVTGVSGSGKTTLVKSILYPALKEYLGEAHPASPGIHSGMEGDMKAITQIEMISQSPIGRSSRSNPVTYVKAYDAIRKLFCNQQLSKIRGFKPKHFSFNVEGGRCETCKGDGEVVIEMQFLADVRLTCEECRGNRFKQEVLDVQYKGKSIFEVLDMSIEESLDFFADEKEVVTKLKPLHDVGLGYVKLGQSSSTLSGGEAQRVKLASFLGKERRKEHIFFIFDEPTTGLHFHDIRRLLDALNALVEKGHTVLVVEHNMEVIKSADWIIDLGPGGGKHGGHLVFQGRPEDLAKNKKSYTGQFLKEKL